MTRVKLVHTSRGPAFSLRYAAATLALSLPLLAGCSVFGPIPQNRGTLVEKSDFKLLVPGTSTKDDVRQLIGSPTTTSTFDDNKWIYISLVTHQQPLSYPKIRKQDVTVLAFDHGGVLRNVSQYDSGDRYNVGMALGATPAPGTKVNIFQQLLGNVGRYNPLGNMNNQFGGSQGPLGGGAIGTGNGGTGNSIP